MKTSWVLEGVDGQVRQLRLRRLGDGTSTCVRPVLTVREVCRRLGKSQRQVYRYLDAGRLAPCARVLGQWLFSEAEVMGAGTHAVPAHLRRLFWDVRLSSLSPVRHRDFILSRVLEFGDRAALRWLFTTYRRDVIAAFLKGRSAGHLSGRVRNFWVLYLGLPPRRQWTPSWRVRGRSWGGVG